MHDKFKLGHICNIAPSKPKVDVEIETLNNWKTTVQAQVKIKTEFRYECLDKLHESLLEYADTITWNDEPGRTRLGETQLSNVVRQKISPWKNNNGVSKCMAKGRNNSSCLWKKGPIGFQEFQLFRKNGSKGNTTNIAVA